MNRMKTLRVGFVALVAAVTGVFVAPAPSMADGDYYDACSASWVSCQTGTRVYSTAGYCETIVAEYGSTRICVDYDGDYVYVYDGAGDQNSAMGYISNNIGDVLDRHCRNPYGAGTWARCNFDWAEAGPKDVSAGIRFSSTSWRYGYLWTFSNY
ncbi:hypothetical protein WEI85_22980 [Actinomycetes bacterium KLBMP 9797]